MRGGGRAGMGLGDEAAVAAVVRRGGVTTRGLGGETPVDNAPALAKVDTPWPACAPLSCVWSLRIYCRGPAGGSGPCRRAGAGVWVVTVAARRAPSRPSRPCRRRRKPKAPNQSPHRCFQAHLFVRYFSTRSTLQNTRAIRPPSPCRRAPKPSRRRSSSSSSTSRWSDALKRPPAFGPMGPQSPAPLGATFKGPTLQL